MAKIVFMNKQGKFFKQTEGQGYNDFTMVDDLQDATIMTARLAVKYPVLKSCIELQVQQVSYVEIVTGV